MKLPIYTCSFHDELLVLREHLHKSDPMERFYLGCKRCSYAIPMQDTDQLVETLERFHMGNQADGYPIYKPGKTTAKNEKITVPPAEPPPKKSKVKLPKFSLEDEQKFGLILGLQGKITPTQIRKKYLSAIKQYHPDKVQHLGTEFQELAEEKTREIMEAYQFFKEKYQIN